MFTNKHHILRFIESVPLNCGLEFSGFKLDCNEEQKKRGI